MKSRNVIKALITDGWVEVSVNGSHHKFKHPTKKGRVIVPHPKQNIPKGTVKSIERQSGVKLL